MGQPRCKGTTADSFFGRFLYDHKVPRDHFLRKLNQVIDWDRFTQKLLKYYKGGGKVGQAPYDPAILLKMLLVAYLYNLSERQVEVLANDSLSVACFLGLGADERVPDHATLTLFKNRLLEGGGAKAYEELFDEMIKIAQEEGVKFGKLQVVDSVHSIADVNVTKDQGRQRGGGEPRDTDARWGAKGGKGKRGGSRAREVTYFYGYKDQVSLNAEVGMVTTIIPGRGNSHDGHQLASVVEKDLAKGIAIAVVAADKGYDDIENHFYLEERGISSAICLNSYRTKKKDKNKGRWVELEGREEYREGLRERYKIERKFGEAKRWHGFSRSRYVGFLRHAIQSYLTFMAVNLKRLVKLLTGVGFKAEMRMVSS